MPVTVVQGLQRGDEGKGRFVDMLASEHEIVARYNGGPNAGHTVILPDDTEFDLHGIPSGIAHPHIMNVIGNGALVDASKLPGEIDKAAAKGVRLTPDNLMISSSAHLILPHLVSIDEIRECGSGSQGTTKSGIAPTAAAKFMREGVRAELINNDPQALFEAIERGLLKQRHERVEARLPNIDEEAVAYEYVEAAQRLGEFVTNTSLFLRRQLKEGANVLAEGAQAFLLDIDHGMYPHVTSSSPTAIGVPSGLGIPPKNFDRIIGVAKAVQSHVGGGHFVTEITDPQLLNRLHGDMSSVDAEKGTTTGRIRRLGHLDLPAIRAAQGVNGDTEMALTKLDWVSRYGKYIKVCVAYERKGKMLEEAPDAEYKIEESTPQYEKLPNWRRDIQDVRRFKDLPPNAKSYVRFIEEMTGVRISMIGVGPKRDQVIICD